MVQKKKKKMFMRYEFKFGFIWLIKLVKCKKMSGLIYADDDVCDRDKTKG